MDSKKLEMMTKEVLIEELEKMQSINDQYRTLLDNASDAIFSFNKEGRYLYVNEEFAINVTGGTPDEIIGKTIWDIFPKDEADKRYAVVQWVFENGKNKSIEVRVPNPEGDTYHLTTVKPIFNRHNKVHMIICIAKEITNRILIEKEREKLIKKLQNALEDIKTLSGLLPICSRCKKIRDDKGYWNSLEEYIEKHSDASFSHGICSDCSDQLYGSQEWYKDMKKNKNV